MRGLLKKMKEAQEVTRLSKRNGSFITVKEKEAFKHTLPLRYYWSRLDD